MEVFFLILMEKAAVEAKDISTWEHSTFIVPFWIIWRASLFTMGQKSAASKRWTCWLPTERPRAPQAV